MDVPGKEILYNSGNQNPNKNTQIAYYLNQNEDIKFDEKEMRDR